jgi:hypothetical protein
MWTLVGTSAFAVAVAPCPQPNLRRQQPFDMWTLVGTSAFGVRALCAGTSGTRGPTLVDLIELA